MYGIVSDFTKYIEESGASHNTALAYGRDARHLADWLYLHGIKDQEKLNGGIIQDYLEKLLEEGRSAATVSRCLAALKKFFSYEKARGLIYVDPTARLTAPKVIKKTPVSINEKQMDKVLRLPDQGTAKGVRDSALLHVLADTGVRVSELIALNVSDIDLKRKLISVGIKRKLRFGEKTAKSISDYLHGARTEFVGDGGTRAFMVSCAGERMTRQGVWKIISSYGEEAGIELSPFILRHSYAVHAASLCRDEKALQGLLGHQSRYGAQEYMAMVR